MAKIKKGDTVIVLSGKDRGKTGTVSAVFPKNDRVVIDGINLVKRHQKPKRGNQKGQIVDKAAPMHISNVALKDSKSGKPTRVGYKTDSKGKKVRVLKKSGTEI